MYRGDWERRGPNGGVGHSQLKIYYARIPNISGHYDFADFDIYMSFLFVCFCNVHFGQFGQIFMQ